MNVHSATTAAPAALRVNVQQQQPIAKTAESAQVTKTKAASTGSSTPKPTSAGTTVTISSAAKAAMEEATETPAQTAQEARGNDHQAQRLLAKEMAAKAGE